MTRCQQQSGPSPNAVLIGGWRHIWDTILQRGCCSWPWFPVFLRRLKAVTRFLRNNKEMVCVCLRRNRCSGLAGMVEGSTFLSFAEWRWGTLYECADIIQSFWASLRCAMELSDFKNQRDGNEMKEVKAAFACTVWPVHLRLAVWLSRWITEAQSWIGGCCCHAEQLLAGEAVECNMKGRRLRQAWVRVSESCATALAEANAWGLSEFCGDAQLWS